MKKLDWSEDDILKSVRMFIRDDCAKIMRVSNPGPVDPVLAKIASDSMIDLLCIKYHNEAKQNCQNYSLTYEELCKRI
jgi:hypothetical protein